MDSCPQKSHRDVPFCAASKLPAEGTIDSMTLAWLGIRILEVMFFAGLAGSTIVVLISFVEDAKELFGEE
jgi:hypothetical protein